MTCKNCTCRHEDTDLNKEAWEDYELAMLGENATMAHRADPGDRAFDDTHDVFTRGSEAERSTRDNGYVQTRDDVNEDSHVDEEYVHAAWQGNIKRTYDAYQHAELEGIHNSRVHFDRAMSSAQTHDNNLNNVALQALQNAVETANMVGKQAVAHRDIATSETWSRLESSDLAETAMENEITRTEASADESLKAIGAAVLAILTQNAVVNPSTTVVKS